MDRLTGAIILLALTGPSSSANPYERTVPRAEVSVGIVDCLPAATGVVVPVYLDITEPVAGFDLEIECDPNVVVTEARAGGGIGSLVLVANLDTGISGQVRLNAVDYSLTGVAGQLSIVELIVDVPPGTEGLLPITITRARLAGLQAETVPVATTDGGVNVTSADLIPTVSEWGMVVTALLLLTMGTLALRARIRVTA